MLACALGTGARGALADSLALSVAPSSAAEGAVATLSLSGNMQPDEGVLLAVNKSTQPCSTDDTQSPAADPPFWLAGPDVALTDAGVFTGTAHVPVFPNPTLEVLAQSNIVGAPPGAYLLCGFIITAVGADAPAAAMASAALTILSPHDTLKIERHRQTITARYHVDPGTYGPGRPLHIFVDACHRGQECYGSGGNRMPMDGGWSMKVHQPDANGNGIATFTFDKYGSFAYPLRNGTLIRCWLHSAESINMYDCSDPANALAVATMRLH